VLAPFLGDAAVPRSLLHTLHFQVTLLDGLEVHLAELGHEQPHHLLVRWQHHRHAQEHIPQQSERQLDCHLRRIVVPLLHQLVPHQRLRLSTRCLGKLRLNGTGSANNGTS
jgi:hypothetical protein